MNPTKNDLPADKRASLCQLLNERLADLIDLQLQAKQAHWNVKGPTFIALHELFDSVAEETEEFVDTVAERVVALGGIAEGTISMIGQRTKLPSYPPNITSGARSRRGPVYSVGNGGQGRANSHRPGDRAL